MIEEFKKIGRLLFEEGLAGGGTGSMSVRQGDEIIITRKGANLADLKDDHLITIGIEPSDADQNAAVEFANHRIIYKTSNAQAVIQAYPAHAIALSLTDEKIIPQDAEGRSMLKSVAIVKTRDSIKAEEAIKVFPSLFSGSYNSAIIRSYCSFVAGANLFEAYQRTAQIEKSSKIIVIARSIIPQIQPPAQRSRREQGMRQSAIPPGIGVMDRPRYQHKR